MGEQRLREHGVTLHGQRVVLRPMTEADWGVLTRWNSDPEVLYCESDHVVCRPCEDVQGIYREVSQTAFCFITEVDGRPIGECWLQQMNYDRVLTRYPGADCRRIDLMIGEKDLWGHGYGTDVIRSLTRFGFDQEGADMLFACGVADYNPRSRRAFEKAGVRVDACLESPPGRKARCEYDLVFHKADYLSARGSAPVPTLPRSRPG